MDENSRTESWSGWKREGVMQRVQVMGPDAGEFDGCTTTAPC